ncbi:hypothetical protein [Streptomyces sp. NBC_00691]|uniref:hypothetical protein n=1 Tax=Streptomyces sp. NBC_00691 TaxID=2903671 RepID=UPI002E306627|nr:hypothetical protein [Streptomyces sp. NBC_00691]
MTFDGRRPRPLQHVTATGTALAVALGPVVVGALLARSLGGDPMASVNALIAGGGQRARISSAQLRSGALRRSGARLRSRVTRGPVRPSRGAGTAPTGRPSRTAPLPRRAAGSAERSARQEEGLRRLLPGVRLTHQPGRLDETGRRQTLGDALR